MSGKLAGRIALITGGTTGIGRAAAELFRDEGATVIVTGTNPANVERVRHDIGVEAIVSDAASVPQIDALIADIGQRHGRIDTLFANAGIPGQAIPPEDMDEATYDRIFGLNTRGLFFTAQKAVSLMPPGSSIVLTGSIAGQIGMSRNIAYAMSKAAVRSMARVLAGWWADRGIRVNALVPGYIATPFFGKTTDLTSDTVREMIAASVPLRRAGDPMEAARAALFLACDDSTFITGTELKVSGGQTDI